MTIYKEHTIESTKWNIPISAHYDDENAHKSYLIMHVDHEDTPWEKYYYIYWTTNANFFWNLGVLIKWLFKKP